MSKGHVLILDDEVTVCELLSERLKYVGFACRTCQNGQEGLALLGQHPFDLVITDFHMPGMSGLEFLEQARRKHPRTVYLMATGENDIRIGIQAMRQGASDYLLKPIQLEALVASVERALAVKRMELELESYRHQLEEKVESRTRQLEAAMKQVEMTYDETLQALGAALDLRDTETAGHSHRVSRYGLEIATAMGCSKEELTQILRGSYLHDIGKIGIPDAILCKEGRLTPQEMEVMRTHVRVGYDLISRIAFLAPAATIVLTHHERWDGTGYPQGLVGENIPIGSRIFAIADTLDAMTTDRPYRKALPFAAAREEIMRCSGRQFDPEIVQGFLTISQSVWENINQEVAGHRPPIYGPLALASLAGASRTVA